MPDNSLYGCRVLVLREEEQGKELASLFQQCGAATILIPLIAFKSNREVLKRVCSSSIATYTMIIFTSANGVRFFMNTLHTDSNRNYFNGIKIIAIGTKTAKTLKDYGIRADAIPSVAQAEGILEMLPQSLINEKILLPVAKGARNLLPIELRLRGAHVDVWPIYETIFGRTPHQKIEDNDYVLFTSPSIVQAFFASGLYNGQTIVPFCIGSITRNELEKNYKNEIITARTASSQGLLEAVIEFRTFRNIRR